MKKSHNIPLTFLVEIQGGDDCVFACPTTKDPVCGSERHEYHNECFLCRAACMMAPKWELTKRCDGKCPCEDDEELMKWQKTHIKAHEDAQEMKEEGWAQHAENFPDHYQGGSDEL